jgi:hypothetical protein
MGFKSNQSQWDVSIMHGEIEGIRKKAVVDILKYSSHICL